MTESASELSAPKGIRTPTFCSVGTGGSTRRTPETPQDRIQMASP